MLVLYKDKQFIEKKYEENTKKEGRASIFYFVLVGLQSQEVEGKPFKPWEEDILIQTLLSMKYETSKVNKTYQTDSVA